MCFSMVASVAAGSTLVAAGAATVGLARRRAELPLALVPLLFGLQQLTEGVVWWSLDHDDAAVDVASTVAYTLFARVLWPVLVPLAVLCLEAVPRRRRAMTGLLVVGGLVAVEGLVVAVNGPHTSSVVGSSIRYAAPSALVVTLYLVATCGACLLSSRRLLRLIGAAALGLGLLTLWLDLAVFVSVWCFFSAVLTVLVLGYFLLLRGSWHPSWV